jgi:hypothetical protein
LRAAHLLLRIVLEAIIENQFLPPEF